MLVGDTTSASMRLFVPAYHLQENLHDRQMKRIRMRCLYFLSPYGKRLEHVHAGDRRNVCVVSSHHSVYR